LRNCSTTPRRQLDDKSCCHDIALKIKHVGYLGSGGARVLEQGGGQIFSVGLQIFPSMGRLYGHLYGAPL